MKDSKKSPFVCTFEKNIADELAKNGFTLMSEDNGKFTFLNNGVLKFDTDKDEDKEKMKKMCFTNVLCM